MRHSVSKATSAVRCLISIAILCLFTLAGASTSAHPRMHAETAIAAALFTQNEASTEDADRIKLLTARRIARWAIMAIREIPNPAPEDYEITAVLLSEASKLVPGDTEILRKLIEARYAAGDSEGVLEATRQLIRYDPDDTVATLRIITSRVNELQTAEERLAIYERILGSADNAIDSTIRSRIALDAALLVRELGDEDRFIELVIRAVELDATNKSAALLASTFYLERELDPVGRIELLANVLLADPLDPSSHLSLARELKEHGAFVGAQRFYVGYINIYLAGNAEPDRTVIAELFTVQWANEGAKAVLDEYLQDEKRTLFLIEQQRKAVLDAGQDPRLVEPYLPNPAIEEVRVMTASALDREEEMASALERVAAQAKAFFDRLDTIQDTVKADEKLEEAQLEHQLRAISERRREFQMRLLWLRLLSGLERQEARTLYDDLAQDGMRDEAQRRTLGWLALNGGDFDRAIDLFEQLADEDPLARVGLGKAFETLGDQLNLDADLEPRATLTDHHRAAIRQYAIVMRDYPGDPMALWARERIQRLLNRSVSPASLTTQIETYAASIPDVVDEMTTDPRNFMHLELEHVTPVANPFESAMLRIRLRNVGHIPLAVGPQSPLNSILLLSPRVSVDGALVIDQTKPEIVHLDRRLRLQPGETIETFVWAGQGQVGDVLDQASTHPISVVWRCIQGFQLVARGDAQYRPGSLCLTATSDLQTRHHIEEPDADIDGLIAALNQARGARFIEILYLVRFRVGRTNEVLQFHQAATEAASAMDARGAAIATQISKPAVEKLLDYWDDFIPNQPAPDPPLDIIGATQVWALEWDPAVALLSEHRDRLINAVADRLAAVSDFERVLAMLAMPPAWLHEAYKPIDDALREDDARLVQLMVLPTRITTEDDPYYDEVIAQGDETLTRLANLLIDRHRRLGAISKPALRPASAPAELTDPGK